MIHFVWFSVKYIYFCFKNYRLAHRYALTLGFNLPTTPAWSIPSVLGRTSHLSTELAMSGAVKFISTISLSISLAWECISSLTELKHTTAVFQHKQCSYLLLTFTSQLGKNHLWLAFVFPENSRLKDSFQEVGAGKFDLHIRWGRQICVLQRYSGSKRPWPKYWCSLSQTWCRRNRIWCKKFPWKSI